MAFDGDDVKEGGLALFRLSILTSVPSSRFNVTRALALTPPGTKAVAFVLRRALPGPGVDGVGGGEEMFKLLILVEWE